MIPKLATITAYLPKRSSINLLKQPIRLIAYSGKHDQTVIDHCIISETSENLVSIADSNINLDDVKFELGTEKFIINLTSLRNNCFCNKCFHQNSRQKLFIPKDFRPENFILNQVRKSNDGIDVSWFDGHESSYSIKLLERMKYFSNVSSISDIPRKDLIESYPDSLDEIDQRYWNAEQASSEMAVVDYSQLTDNNIDRYVSCGIFNANKVSNEFNSKQIELLGEILKSLVTYGIAKIINVPQQRTEVIKVARLIAYERPTGYGSLFDVVVEPSDDINLAYSSLEFDLHTDLPYREFMPGVQLLHCIKNSCEGGDSYFSDGFKAATKLQNLYPRLFHILTLFPNTYSARDPYRNLNFSRQQTIVSIDYGGQLESIHYSPFHLPPLGNKYDIKLFYLAIDKFTQYLQSKEQKLITKMNPGDLFIFNNRRILHGRSAYNPSIEGRFLQGCYMDWDEIKALYKRLR